MRLTNRRPMSIVLALVAILAVVVCLAWSPGLLWLAKNQAARKYARMQDEEVLNRVLSSKVKSIQSDVSEGERAGSELDGYLFSFPSPKYRKLSGDYLDFDSDKLRIRCLGVLSLTGEFAKAGAGGSPTGRYLERTDPFQILIDAFSARPEDIERQKTLDDLNKHLALLAIKAQLMKIGSEKLWERFDTRKRQGIIAGDTSMRGIPVTLYLPESREFADVLIKPKDRAKMDDVYTAISELDIQRVPKR